jgi:hypothetical protein
MESSTERPTESPTESPADITNGQIMDKTTMTCRRWPKKRKKKAMGMSNDEIKLYTTKRPPYVCRKGNWNCPCGYHNFADKIVCEECGGNITNGIIMDQKTMTCRRWRKKKKKKTEGMSYDKITLYTRLKEWSEVNPYGKVVKVEMNKCKWPQDLIQHGTRSNGSYIHTQTSKWKYFKINMGTATPLGKDWLRLNQDIKCMLNIVAQKCISIALSDVAQYKDCDRTVGSHGAVWSMPCGRASELCSLIYQPKGSLQQLVHKDGHQRYALPEDESIVFNSYFLNVIVPLQGDIPTLFRGNDRKLHASSCCAMDEVRVFNGGAWHAGAANDTSEGVWKLFIGLVPDNYRSNGDHPIFEDGVGKDAAKEKDRILLIADDE